MNLKTLPIGRSAFTEIINNNFLYVDKTQCIYELLKGAGMYFLARSRRFGKSLLISTLHEIFNGNKELFKDLWLYEVKSTFTEHLLEQFTGKNIYLFGVGFSDGNVKEWCLEGVLNPDLRASG